MNNQIDISKYPAIAVFVINPDNNKESMCIQPKDVVKGYKYNDYLLNDKISKRLFVREGLDQHHL